MIIKNFGKECGASLNHNHSQLITFPFTPSKIEREMIKAKEFFEKTGKNAFLEIGEKESKTKRGLFENKSFYAITPFAPKWTFEVWIIPKKQYSNLGEMEAETLRDLGEIMQKALKKIHDNLGNPPYNYYLHESMEKNKSYCFHVEIQPNVKKIYGGIEKAADIILIEVAPEQAAGELKK